MKIVVKDDTIGGKTKHSFTIETSINQATVRALIRLRIFEEVRKYNEAQPEYFRSLVQPTEAEVTLNGYKMINKRKLDPEKQFYLALDAFYNNGYFLIVNDKQVESLEEQIQLQDNMELQFIKLTPLVGG